MEYIDIPQLDSHQAKCGLLQKHNSYRWKYCLQFYIDSIVQNLRRLIC